jgi:hypothetical protein
MIGVDTMHIKLYTVYDDPRKVGKTLGTALDLAAVFIYPTDIYRPSVRVSSTGISNRTNYMYISDTGRYYFITDVTYDSGGAVIIHGRVDVLQTYAAAIKALECSVVRQEHQGMSKMIDSQITMTPEKTLTYLKCTKTPFNIRRSNTQHNYVLCVAGGEQGV